MSTSMAEADREIGREFATLRKVRLYPGKCAKQGCLAKWINAIRVQATIKGCADMIPAMDAEGKCRIPTVPTDDKELIEFLKRQWTDRICLRVPLLFRKWVRIHRYLNWRSVLKNQ